MRIETATRSIVLAILLTAVSLVMPISGFENVELRCVPAGLEKFVAERCLSCHSTETAEGGLNLEELSFELDKAVVRERWIKIHDRVQNNEMPPEVATLKTETRNEFTSELSKVINEADLATVKAEGRGPLRRLNRFEYEQNLRDAFQSPLLDVRDLLPEDREGFRFHKTAQVLDISRVQLEACLDAAESALNQAIGHGAVPPPQTKFRAVGRKLFAETSTFGNREAMFFAKNAKAIEDAELMAAPESPEVELALFRSAHWPYYGYPIGFVATQPGNYRVRFSARAVLQQSGFVLTPADRPIAMSFRARKPSGPDVSGDVRGTGGWIDIAPTQSEFETVINLRPGETFEYSLLGLPVPLARNVDGGPPTYRYPPFPVGGQPGVAIQWLELEGPIAASDWPPRSHRVLFDDLSIEPSVAGSLLPIHVLSSNPQRDAARLLLRFANQVAREPISSDAIQPFEQLVKKRLDRGVPFAEALLAGCKAFLCSEHFLFLREPRASEPHREHFAIASRLSHFLTDSRPDSQLLEHAVRGELRSESVLEAETLRLMEAKAFERFVQRFTDDWLGLRYLQRDEPDAKLYPEYRFNAYLVESMGKETRAYFAAMVRENLSATALVHSDFVFVNDQLAEHYQLAPIHGSFMRKVTLPAGSPYGGLLTQGAVLKVTANGTSSSPVLRGAWVMERLLGEPPPPPPAKVPAVEPDIRGATSIRELLALHTNSEACRNCHARFDPVGLALENFDVMGRWRDRYRGLESGERVTGIDRAGHDFAYTSSSKVDASGQLLDGYAFENIQDLRAHFVSNPRQLARNLLRQFTIYATGTPVRFSDRAVIESILDKCAHDNYRVRDLMVALIQSPIFLGYQDSEGGSP